MERLIKPQKEEEMIDIELVQKEKGGNWMCGPKAGFYFRSRNNYEVWNTFVGEAEWFTIS